MNEKGVAVAQDNIIVFEEDSGAAAFELKDVVTGQPFRVNASLSERVITIKMVGRKGDGVLWFELCVSDGTVGLTQWVKSINGSHTAHGIDVKPYYPL